MGRIAEFSEPYFIIFNFYPMIILGILLLILLLFNFELIEVS